MADYSLMMACPTCKVWNYLDPFTFWNFKGKVKCAGCDAVWAVAFEKGHRVSGPDPAKAPHDKLPGYAQTPDYKKDFREAGRVNPAPKARADFQGKPIPMYTNVRGRLVSGGPLKREDLAGSRPRFILEGKPYQPKKA